ncbi:synaptic vesicular amine transporter [Condylostylus longicornis]|uniref:synaptic vesicular amine transporter n=1 Tax=Condylostylus longicornis TaxID=2530218 RepID=UPI00244E0D85|nr:synaptic vesicular amine transporter [Condylostylus longicornis]
MNTVHDEFTQRRHTQNRYIISVIVYLALLADNILLTVIVPILPDFLAEINNKTEVGVPQSVVYKNYDLHYVPNILTKHPIPGKSLINSTSKINDDKTFLTVTHSRSFDKENFSIGLLLAMKAFVQLICNPIIGGLTTTIGFYFPICFGTCCIFISSFVFATGQTYTTILLARMLQGVGSSCISVCGMSLVAQLYPEEDKRSKIMGVILGSVALGVLIGYPLGGIAYDFVGKSAPFVMLCVFIAFIIALQILHMEFNKTPDIVIEAEKPKWKFLLKNQLVMALALGILLSTSAMAILEPCLPLWLLQNLNPKKWQLGTVFIPDSIGYFIGTNFFGMIAYNFGQIKISCIALATVGISCLAIPIADSVYKLLLPHFCLGMSIGIIDAALVPLLASLVELKINDDESTASGEIYISYGSVYAIQQTSVSLAYSLGPLIGGELAETIGFPWLMRIVGLLNIAYGPSLIILYRTYHQVCLVKENQLILSNSDEVPNYKRLYNSID